MDMNKEEFEYMKHIRSNSNTPNADIINYVSTDLDAFVDKLLDLLEFDLVGTDDTCKDVEETLNKMKKAISYIKDTVTSIIHMEQLCEIAENKLCKINDANKKQYDKIEEEFKNE